MAFLWLTCGPNLANRSGPPKCHILHSMWARARCWIWAGSGPELKSMGPRFETVLLYLVYSWLTLGLPLAYFGPNLANRSGPPKCHYSTWSVGQMKVSGVGLIWTSGILLSGMYSWERHAGNLSFGRIIFNLLLDKNLTKSSL